jgi:hypothetical protein
VLSRRGTSSPAKPAPSNSTSELPRSRRDQASAEMREAMVGREDDFAGMNDEWLKWFPANPPARQGAKLPARIPGLKVSIAAIAEA